MEISNLKKKSAHITGVSGNMSMLYDRLVGINYQICDDYYHTIIHENLYVNIDSALKRNVLTREHAE